MRGGLRRSQNERLLQDLRADLLVCPHDQRKREDIIPYDGQSEDAVK
jgi:hypothetical protein